MLPEDRLAERLDGLLAARRAARRRLAPNGASILPSDVQLLETDDLDELGPAIAAAERLEPVRAMLPRADFAQALEQRVFDQIHALREVHERETSEREASGTVDKGASAARLGRALRRRKNGPTVHLPRRGLSGRWRLTQTLAAGLLLTFLGAGVLAVTAASALPGSPLYGMRRLEQNLHASMAATPADQVLLHLQYANEALDALDSAVAQQAGIDTYRAAMTTARDEEQAAAAALAGVAPGDELTSLTSQLAALQQREHHDVHAALLKVDWQSRLFFTTTLGQLGEVTPVVTAVHIEYAGGDDSEGSAYGRQTSYQWIVELTGSGFQTGAICVVDGHPIGTTLSVTPTRMVVGWPGAAAPSGADFGIQNPDGTAAQTANVQRGEHNGDDTATPSTTPSTTPTDDNHYGGGGQGTPTPRPTPVPTVSPTSPVPTPTPGGSGGGGDH